MANLFKAPSPPQQDSQVTALQQQEQARAEADRLSSMQDQLGAETRIRNRGRTGLLSLLGTLGQPGLRSLLGSG